MSGQDRVYGKPNQHIVDFVFDTTVVDVFPDMIRRSVPGYETVIPITGLIAAQHIAPGGRVYDLGCSLGATTLAVLRQLNDTPCKIIAVDNAPAMIARARELVTDSRVHFKEADILDLEMEGASVVLLNYVLQFVSLDDRLTLLNRIQRSLLPSGRLILSEKIRFEDAETHAYYDALHLHYKRANGYSELEISQKRTALENVMITDSIDEHLARFRAAGFSQAEVWFRCLNWASFLVTP
ncbi:MAG: carboxy-S-adenosyl-L-methionine synthase CmoA [Gammaproteobacteria bacterium]|nr:carboxy-S-adenosyl-L-methionine synthase CmoA [Gammaproteobacteria bacterium]MCZ6853633.1 carboxy-S-adenosyl-L-methionine synthase CmoA [Gammaproteobacteria bacterium]